MIDKPLLYLLVKTAALAVSILVLNPAETDITKLVISALGFVCIFVLELLLNQLFGKDKWVIVTLLISGGACFYLGLDVIFPLFAVLLLHILDITLDKHQFYQIN